MNEIIYKIRVNRPCRLFIDDEELMVLEESKLTKITLFEGEYLRKVVALDNDKVYNESILTLINHSKVEDVRLDLNDIKELKLDALKKGELQVGDLMYKYLDEKSVSVVKNVNEELEELIIPSYINVAEDSYNVTEIGEEAFKYCHSIKSVSIPNTITTIRRGAFWNCNGFTLINIPYSVEIIEEEAFNTCANLSSITLERNLISIGKSAFTLTRLQALTIPHGVKYIGPYVINGCGFITSITLPNTIEKLPALSSYWQPCSLSKIIFKGTKNEWEHLKKDDKWWCYTKIKLIHCIDGDIEF
jgi:hypothetical protein